MRFRSALFAILFVCAPALYAADSPRDVLAALNALRLDSDRVYTIAATDRIELHQGDLVLAFERGKLVFFQPFEGHVNGFLASPQPVDWKTDSVGVFLQTGLKFGPYPVISSN